MQERVDRALKNYEPREEKRTSVLKSVVLNASDMFTERKLSKQSDRPFYTRLDRTVFQTALYRDGRITSNDHS
jgi:hypothetical protein